jgi:hypothetical protein
MRIDLQLLRFGIGLFLDRGIIQLEAMRFEMLPGIFVVVVA